jgi:5-methylcytosine-specific restriction endonuclease McrA
MGKRKPAPETKRYAPVSIKQTVWEKSEGQCTYIDDKTGRRCNSTYKLELHHKVPFAMGGLTTRENLTLLCHKHNIFEAIKDYVLKKMKPYIQSSDQKHKRKSIEFRSWQVTYCGVRRENA